MIRNYERPIAFATASLVQIIRLTTYTVCNTHKPYHLKQSGFSPNRTHSKPVNESHAT